jgi:hypothetical protein
VLLDRVGIAQVVVDRDAGIIDQDIEGFDLTGRPLDLRSAGHVQRQGRHALVGVFESAARSRIDPLRPPSQCLIDERPADASVGAGNHDCLTCNVHTPLLFKICNDPDASPEPASSRD